MNIGVVGINQNEFLAIILIFIVYIFNVIYYFQNNVFVLFLFIIATKIHLTVVGLITLCYSKVYLF